MKARSLVPLLVLALTVGLYIYFFERGEVRKRTHVFRAGKERIVRVELAKEGGEKIVLEKSDDRWRLVSPLKGRADQMQVESLLTSLSGLEEQSRVKGEALDLKEIGLQQPSLSLSVWKKRDGEPETLQFGDETPDGSGLYARYLGDKEVLVLPSYVRTQFDKDPESLRDKQAFHFAMNEEVSTIDLRRGKEIISLRREKGTQEKPGEWRITAPVGAKADPMAVDELLRALRDLRLENFTEQEPKDLRPLGLAEPRLVVTVAWKKKDEKRSHTDTLFVGGPAEGNQVYVRSEGEPAVAQLPTDQIAQVDKSLFDLRDKRVLEVEQQKVSRVAIRKDEQRVTLVKKDKKWRVEPGNKPADESEVADLLWNLADLRAERFVAEQARDLTKYGLDKPSIEVTLESGGRETGFIASRAPDASEYYLKNKGAAFVAVVPAASLDAISANPADYQTKPVEKEKQGAPGEQPAKTE